jgi:hypothetical protein
VANPKGNEKTLVKYKPKWRSGKTRTIRVPIAIADQVLEFANKVDRGESSSTVTSETSFDRNNARHLLASMLAAPSNKGGRIKELAAELGNVIGIKIEKVKGKWRITDTSD